MEKVADFIFFCFKIAAASDCSQGTKSASFLEGARNLNSILKSRDTILWTKVSLVKAMVFPIVHYDQFP